MKARLASPARHLTPARLRAILRVAETGTFAAAARAMGVSHSAVAQQIRELEAEQGVQLFDRVGGVLRPTPICQELCDIGERINEAQRDAERVLLRRDSAGRRWLRVGLGNSMPGIALIADVISQLPALSTVVVTGSHQTVLTAVLRREVEIGILPDVPRDPRFRRTPLLSQEPVAIVSPRSPLADRGFLTLEELAGQPLIFRARGSSTQKFVDRAFRSAGLAPDPVLVADTRDAVYEAVAVGIGIGFMWHHGSARNDAVRRIAVPELGAKVEEVVFALSDEKNDIVDHFFVMASQFRVQ